MEINLNNYHIASQGIFNPISNIPIGFKRVFNSRSSQYYINEDKSILIRRSNHWGTNIKKCKWFLNGFDECHCGDWSYGYMIGMIKFENLNEIN